MERTPSPDKLFRPLLRRSVTASPETSSPSRSHDLDGRLSRVSAIPSQAARKLHLHTRGLAKDENRLGRNAPAARHGGHSHSPAHAVKDLAKGAGSKAASSGRRLYESGDADDQSSAQLRQPLDEDGAGGRVTRAATREDVMAERKRRSRRTEELSKSLHSLSELATGMSRQLDSTYYALLGKAEKLRKMVQQLQQLNSDSTELQRGFEKEVVEMQKSINRDVEGFGEFHCQKSQIEELEVRMKKSIEKAKTLSERLTVARRRVGRWEVREKEWQDKTSARLRASAITFGLTVGMVVLLLIVQITWLNRNARDGKLTYTFSQHDDTNLWDLRHGFSLPFRRPAVYSHADRLQSLGDDKRLRLLDEL